MRYAKRVVMKEAYEYGEYDFRKIHYIELSRNDIGIQLEKLINKGETSKEMLQDLSIKCMIGNKVRGTCRGNGS